MSEDKSLVGILGVVQDERDSLREKIKRKDDAITSALEILHKVRNDVGSWPIIADLNEAMIILEDAIGGER